MNKNSKARRYGHIARTTECRNAGMALAAGRYLDDRGVLDQNTFHFRRRDILSSSEHHVLHPINLHRGYVRDAFVLRRPQARGGKE